MLWRAGVTISLNISYEFIVANDFVAGNNKSCGKRLTIQRYSNSSLSSKPLNGEEFYYDNNH